MKIAAVICEYNPFHNGHKYQLDIIKNELGFDFVIAIMSGNFVQRGEPAVFDKFVRTKAALLSGADLVLELPSIFAVSSAGEFARAGVSLAEKCGIVDALCFGTEGCIGFYDLNIALKIYGMAHADAGFKERLRSSLKEGKSYPAALSEALREYCVFISNNFSDTNGSNFVHDGNGTHVCCRNNSLYLPNNILALEYMKALSELAPDIAPIAIPRKGAGYNDTSLDSGGFSSASAIRDIIGKTLRAESCEHPCNIGLNPDSAIYSTIDKNNSLKIPESPSTGIGIAPTLSMHDIKDIGLAGSNDRAMPPIKSSAQKHYTISILHDSVPAAVYSLYANELSAGNAVLPDHLSPLLSMRLLDAAYYGKDLSSCLDVSRELSGSFLSTADRPMGYDERAAFIKSRNYALSRIKRAQLHIVLNMTNEEFELRKNNGYVSYLRILGFTKKAAELGLLKKLKQKAKVPIVTKPADGKALAAMDIYRDQIYYSLKNQKGEYERSPVIV